MKTLKRGISAAALVVAATLSAGCSDFLDINTNPNAPETASANLYLPPMLHELVTAPQIDGRFVGRYTQQWTLVGTSLGTWDRMGYDPGSDNGGWMWRAAYFSLGQNLVDMMTKAEAEERWDLLGVGYLLKAWGWQVNTDHSGEIIVKEAINQNTFTFNYDSQEYAYQEVKRLLDKAIEYLSRTDGAVDASYMARGDKIYNGDRTKWLKLAYGLLAIHLNHYSNKAAYKPDDVIAAVDKSFTSNADDALLPYPATATDDASYWSPLRVASSLVTNYRQTQFVVNLMNGTQFGGAVDPRMSRMLSPAPDGEYRGLDINVVGYGALTVAQRPNNFWGYAAVPTVGQPTRYIFDSKSRVPVMTYAQLQFVKAEAAYKKGDMATARAAYLAGVGAHLDFVNARNMDAGGAPTQISAAERTAFLAHPGIMPAQLTLSHIMSQKYIAQWGWGHNELWMDMRRYHYTDMDPVSGTQVFRGFAPPTTLYPDNGGKVVQRIRPRYNSEYVWNRPGLDAIGGLALDYHTKPLWITER